MSDRDERLLQRLLPIFKEEAREHISEISEKLATLETAPLEARPALVEIAFREAHSLKAAARAVRQPEIEQVCQAVEGSFAALKRAEIEPSAAFIAGLVAAADALEDFRLAIDAPPDPQRRARATAMTEALELLLRRARSAEAQPSVPPTPTAPLEAPAPELGLAAEPERDSAAGAAAPAAETVRISVQRLDGLLLQAEEMLAQKLAAQQRVAEIKEAAAALPDWRTELRQFRAASREFADAQPGQNARLAELLDREDARLRALEERLAALDRAAGADARGLGAKVDRLLYDMKQILTLPCSHLLQFLPRTVRELAREQGKEVALDIEGAELEMDRHILEELRDPLLHLVRNCVDHGIEPPEARERAGKPRRATVTIAVAAVEGDKAEFVIADDGAGIATRKLVEAAVRLGVLPAEPGDAESQGLLQLIFQSGVSTSPMITDLSGRGLGLAIVREKVERLGGRVSVESTQGQGTRFRLVVPLTLATYHGIVVRLGERRFVLPTLGVERVIFLERSALAAAEDRVALELDGMPVPLVELAEVLELPAAPEEARGARIAALLIGTMAQRVAFAVDAIEGDQEILVKPLGGYLLRVRNVQGATVLANGTIAPILNLHDLLKSAAKALRRPARPAPSDNAVEPARRTILLAEDSVTARGLLRHILETAGYRVKAAADGAEAWAALKLEPFDVVVTDVEMPRMNGFELTKRIRADRALRDLPVVLVTALDTREDRERGVDAGANAYVTKGGFEQSRLLETIRRLV